MTFRHVRLSKFLVAVFAATGVVGLVSCGNSSTQMSADTVELESMQGDVVTIGDTLGDRPLLVSLWAVWCQPCKRELPELQKISDEDRGVDVLAVNVGDDPERIAQYLTEMSLDVPVAIDPVGDLLTALDVSTVPATVLFDRGGNVLWSHLGAVTAQQVAEALSTFVPADEADPVSE